LLQDGSVEKVIESAILAEIPCINIRKVIASEKLLRAVRPIEYYVMSVTKLMDVRGVSVSFSYENTYTEYSRAVEIAKKLQREKDTLEVKIGIWYLMPDGTKVTSNESLFEYKKEEASLNADDDYFRL
jgi:hypothetical protein